jgi:S1-C subfamily serine protease
LLAAGIVAAGCSSGSINSGSINSGSTGSGSSDSSGASGGSDGGSGGQLQSQYETTVKDVLPSVVQISTNSGSGSGVVFDSHGDVVTNAHVVAGAKSVQVRDAAGKVTDARVVGEFSPDDLAVVHISGDSSLKPATWANSNGAQVGEIVLAMGNPLGLSNSVTQGIVSATGRTVGEGSGSNATITGAIQTSAAINPGNSGGALVNLQNQVLGIPTLGARLPDEGGAAPGIGFAIPSNTVRNVAGQLVKNGKVTNSGRASLGIGAQTAASKSGDPSGVAVDSVASGGPAAKAGLHEGDVIRGINNQSTPTVEDLQAKLAEFKPGQKVTVHYVRDGDSHTTTATLGSLSS